MKETEKLIIKFHTMQIFLQKSNCSNLGRGSFANLYIYLPTALNNFSEATVAGGAQRYRLAKLARSGQLDCLSF